MKNFLCGILFCLMVLCSGQAHAVTMTSGTVTSGSVPGPVPCNPNPPGSCYSDETFAGTAGQSVIGTIVDGFGAANWTIFIPGGGTYTGSGAFQLNSLPATGTYTLRISSPSTGYGAYSVYYVAGGEGVSNGALTSGATKHDSLPAGGLTSYTFSGTSGQGMQLRFTAASAAWNAYIRVYTPSGTYVNINTNSYVYNLTATGTYNVVVQSTGTGNGSYDLSYVIGGGAVSDGAIASGGSKSATLALGQMNSFTFSGTTGHDIGLAVGGISWGTTFYVYTPDGHYWSSSSTNNFFTSTQLPQTGTYTVVFFAQTYTSTGSYTLYYTQAGDSTSQGPILSGSSDSSNLASNQLRSYSFSGTTGRAISIHLGATYATTIRVYTPDGHYLGYSFSGVYNNTSLTQTNSYTVMVDPQSYSSSPSGNYNFYYVQGNDDVSEGYLITTRQRQGTMALNEIKSYKFNAKASTAITINTSCPFAPTYGCYALLFKPDGSYWGYIINNYSGTTPAAAGNYTLVLYEYTGTLTGDYSVTVTVTPEDTTPSNKEYCPTCGSMGGDPNTGGVEDAALGEGGSGSPVTGNAPGAPAGSPLGGLLGSLSGLANTIATSLFNTGGVAPFTGNSMQFDIGFKEQVATDYQAGGLSFTRIYRSDSTWTDNTVGNLWRHNYARKLNVGASADITDGSGVRNYYTASGSNWIPAAPGNMAKLETITGGYKYTLPNGNIEYYNSSKLLTRIEFLGGGALNLTYNGSSQLTGVANENGRSISLTYSSGRVATVVTPDGTFSYSYTGGNLTTVTKPDTKTITYHYENGTYTSALTGITDEKGVRLATFGYDGSGRVNASQLSGGVDAYSITYNTNNSVTTNPLGKTFSNYYANDIQGVRHVAQVDGAASTNTPASSMYFNYDVLGRMIGKTDWKNVMTRYYYDSRSNVTRIKEAVGTANQRETIITWDATWNLPNVITEPGRTTDFDYDAYGRLTTVTVTDQATAATRITTYTYYSNSTDGAGNVILGRLHVIDGPRTDVTDTTTYAYDANFDLTTVTNALSQVTTVTARDTSGRPTKVTDPNSVETDLAYNTNGRVTSVIGAFGTGLAATTAFTYDDDQQLTKITLPNSVYVQYSYDNAQRLTGVNDVPGNTITYTLDNAGDPTQTLYKNTTPTTTYSHTRTYDELTRLLHSVGAASQTAIFAWDTNSNLTTYTDPRTNATGYTYDPLQRLATATNALSGVTTPGYNTLDYVTSVKDQRNNSTTYTYNAFGDVTGETSPNRGTLAYTVDKAGNVTQRTDARSVVTNFTYDAISRLLTVAYPSDTSLNVSLTYDSSSGCGTPYKGHLCSVTDAAGTTAYQYDVLGRATQGKDTRGALNFTTAYSYDLAGNISGLTLPSGRTVTYTRDTNGRVSGVSATVNGSSTTLASSGAYLPFGPLKGLTYGNSLTFSATYNTDYYLTNRTVSGSIYNWTYTPDANGNITQAGATTYGYDVLNRVNAENPGTSASYTYDATSNRLTKVQGGTTTTTVPSTSNKISAVGANSYTYDAAGNITGDGVNTYTWSAAGLLGIVKVGGTTVGTYTYNAANQRAKKVAASTTYYVYGAGGKLYGEYDSSGNFIREYVYLNSAALAQINSGSPEVLTYLHTDHLGTPRFGTNASGTQVWAWTNDAFGTSAPSGSVTVNLRMAGQYYDSESGLFYNWNRVYNPAIGRYISSDPIGINGGLNTFGYVGQNPVNLFDRLGLAEVPDDTMGPLKPGDWWASHPDAGIPGYGTKCPAGTLLVCRGELEPMPEYADYKAMGFHTGGDLMTGLGYAKECPADQQSKDSKWVKYVCNYAGSPGVCTFAAPSSLERPYYGNTMYGAAPPVSMYGPPGYFTVDPKHPESFPPSFWDAFQHNYQGLPPNEPNSSSASQ